MSQTKKTYPKSDAADRIGDLFGKPQNETVKNEPKIKDESPAEKTGVKAQEPAAGQESTPKTVKTAGKGRESASRKQDRAEETEQPQSPTAAKREKRDYVMTYFSEENYNSFEEMFDETKRHVRQRTGTKLKATNVAEMAIMIAFDMFREDKKGFLDKMLTRIQKTENK